MITLYSLFLSDHGGARRFVPVHCASHVELLRSAKAALEADADAQAVEARFGQDLLFTLEKDAEGPGADA
jgi:predicted P-loop ATPase